MGRPLYSSTYETPAVRVAPDSEPHQATYEKWSYWNPFDPDSDEFLDSAEDEWLRTPSAAELSEIRGLVEEMGSSSSEESSSGRATPTFADDGPSVEEVNVELRRRVAERTAHESPESLASERDAQDDNILDDVYQDYPSPVTPPRSRPALSYVRVLGNTIPTRTRQDRSRSPVRIPRAETEIEPISITRPAPTRSVPIAIPARPFTPPNQTANSYGTPSPAPSVTPRLYTWTSRPTTSESPLPNRNARMSMAHVSSPSVSAQRVVV